MNKKTIISIVACLLVAVLLVSWLAYEIKSGTKATEITLEEAQKVVVDTGTCVGRTIQEVADTRPATLKYFQFGGYKGGNNILIAAATIMYKHLESQRLGKAG